MTEMVVCVCVWVWVLRHICQVIAAKQRKLLNAIEANVQMRWQINNTVLQVSEFN